MNSTNIKPYSKAIVKLLKGIVEKNDVVWNDVLTYQSDIQDYIAIMGLVTFGSLGLVKLMLVRFSA